MIDRNPSQRTGTSHGTPIAFLLGTVALLFPLSIGAITFDDVMVSYSLMRISEADLASRTDKIDFYRHNTMVQLGKGPATVGFVTQRTVNASDASSEGTDETGFMLTAGYGRILSEKFRVKFAGRVGLSPHTDESQPLYATDTDVRIKLVRYCAEGLGAIAGAPLFPSLYAGAIVNRYGRVQGIGGGGVWWKGAGAYVTAFQAVNGVDDPDDAGARADYRYADLKNAGISLSATYDFADCVIALKKNFPIENGGDDLTFSFSYLFFPGGDEEIR